MNNLHLQWQKFTTGTNGTLLYTLDGIIATDAEYRTGSNIITVYFDSDNSVVRSGFKIHYFAKDLSKIYHEWASF